MSRPGVPRNVATNANPHESRSAAGSYSPLAAGMPGAQPATQLADFYLKARDKARAAAGEPDEDEDGAGAAEEAEEPDDERAAPPFKNPKPWETVVRIKVRANGSIGYGSGTIIYSTPKESLILTCAHIFKLEGQAQAPPSKFPRPITIDLFDGRPLGDTTSLQDETVPARIAAVLRG